MHTSSLVAIAAANDTTCTACITLEAPAISYEITQSVANSKLVLHCSLSLTRLQ